MGTLRAFAVLALAFALARAGSAATFAFDDEFDLRFTELVRNNVTFSVDPPDSAVYGAGFYALFDGFELVSGPALELDGGTVLTIQFGSALDSVQLDVAHAGLSAVADVATVRVFGASGAELIWNDVLAPPFSGGAYERRYAYFGGGVLRVTIDYGDYFSFAPFAVDNLVVGAAAGGPPPPVIPEPATYAYLLSGLLALLSLRRLGRHGLGSCRRIRTRV